MQIDLGPVNFRPGFSCQFPNNLCVNCGATTGLSAQTMDVRSVTYLLFAGTEVKLPLPAAACDSCTPSLSRHPFSPLNKLLVMVLASCAFMVGLLIPMQMGKIGDSFVGHHFMFLSVVLGVGVTLFWFGGKRPKPPQTSYYQPVRLKELKRSFATGEIQAMTLGFTNAGYLRAFTRLNQAAIEGGFLKVLKA
jgi:hypothetical protein